MKRTVEDACPYRGLDDFRLFVRRRKVVRTRIRTPHPSAFGCHLPPLGKALGKCEHRLKPKDSADSVTAGCKHTPLRSVASLLRKHCPRPTAVNEISFVGEAFRLPFCKQAARTNKMAAHQIPPFIVGGDVLDAP